MSDPIIVIDYMGEVSVIAPKQEHESCDDILKISVARAGRMVTDLEYSDLGHTLMEALMVQDLLK